MLRKRRTLVQFSQTPWNRNILTSPASHHVSRLDDNLIPASDIAKFWGRLSQLYQRANLFYENIFLECTGDTRLEYDRRPNFLITANITFVKNPSLFWIRQCIAKHTYNMNHMLWVMWSSVLRTSQHSYALGSDHHVFLLELIKEFKMNLGSI